MGDTMGASVTLLHEHSEEVENVICFVKQKILVAWKKGAKALGITFCEIARFGPQRPKAA